MLGKVDFRRVARAEPSVRTAIRGAVRERTASLRNSHVLGIHIRIAYREGYGVKTIHLVRDEISSLLYVNLLDNDSFD